MKKSYTFFLFLFSLLLALQVSAIDVTTCGTLNSAGATYNLLNDIQINTTGCFSITEDGITLNGNGFTITQNRTGTLDGVYATPVKNTTIKNLTIVDFPFGVYLPSNNNSIVQDVTIINSTSTGLYGPSALRLQIVNVLINGSEGEGMYITSADGSRINDVEVVHSGQEGMLISSSGNVTLANSTIAHSGLHGLALHSDAANISGNIIKNNTQNGIRSTGSNTIYATNQVLNNTLDGIYLLTGSANTLSANIIRSNKNNGIFLNASSQNNITQNIVSSNFNRGMQVDVLSNKNNISHNTVASNGVYGILVKSSKGNIVQENRLASTGLEGITFYNASDGTIYANNVSGSDLEGIHLQAVSSNNSVNNNRLDINTDHGIYVSQSNNNTISQNILQINGDGIGLYQASGNNFTLNNISTSTRYGIQIVGGSINNNFSRDSIYGSDQHAIFINVSTFTQFFNILIADTAGSSDDLHLIMADNTQFYSLSAQGDINSTNSSNLVFGNLSFGEVHFPLESNVSATDISAIFQFTSNNIGFEEESTFNQSANITIFGTPGSGKTNLYIARNNVECTECVALTALDEENVSFNVTRGGNYSIEGTTPSSGSSGGSGGSSRKVASKEHIFSESLEYLQSFTVELASGNSVYFKIGREEHHLTINDVDDQNVKLTMYSTPKQRNFSEGESEDFDLNEDGVNETRLSVGEIKQEKVTITLSHIEQQETNNATETLPEIKEETSPTQVNQEQQEQQEEPEAKKAISWKILLFFIMLIGGGTLFWFKSGRYIRL